MAQASGLGGGPQHIALDDSDEDEDLQGLASRSIVRKPDKIPVRPEEFEEWAFEFENFMTVVRPQYLEDLRLAVETQIEEGMTLTDTGTAGLRKRSVLLYAVLARLAQGKAKTIMAPDSARVHSS